MKMNKYSFFLAMLLLSISVFAQEPNSQHELVFVEIEDLRENRDTDSVITDRIYYALHDGSFDIFDYGQPASDALASFASYGSADELLEMADDIQASSSFEYLLFPSWLGAKSPLIPPLGAPSESSVFDVYPTADPLTNQYFSFFTRIHPSDDAFIANEDPKRFKLFDKNGQFKGPFVIDVYGSDILDAGTQINDEQDLLIADFRAFDLAIPDLPLRTEEGPVQHHPGFIGSSRSGELELGRILSEVDVSCLPAIDIPGTFRPSVCTNYSANHADFTRPDQPLFRIRINASSRIIHGGWSGSYFDPSRSGEGFSFEFFDGNPDRVKMFWHTYSQDSSGDQLWLIGQGEKVLGEFDPMQNSPSYFYQIVLYSTRGGQLTSMQNPDQVELIPWGSARLIHSSVEGASLQYQPACERLRLYDIEVLDDSIHLNLPISEETGLPFYELQRLGQKLSGAESLCGAGTGYPLLAL